MELFASLLRVREGVPIDLRHEEARLRVGRAFVAPVQAGCLAGVEQAEQALNRLGGPTRSLIDVRGRQEGFVPERPEGVGESCGQREVRLAGRIVPPCLFELLGAGITQAFFELTSPDCRQQTLRFGECALGTSDFRLSIQKAGRGASGQSRVREAHDRHTELGKRVGFRRALLCQTCPRIGSALRAFTRARFEPRVERIGGVHVSRPLETDGFPIDRFVPLARRGGSLCRLVPMPSRASVVFLRVGGFRRPLGRGEGGR